MFFYIFFLIIFGSFSSSSTLITFESVLFLFLHYLFNLLIFILLQLRLHFLLNVFLILLFLNLHFLHRLLHHIFFRLFLYFILNLLFPLLFHLLLPFLLHIHLLLFLNRSPTLGLFPVSWVLFTDILIRVLFPNVTAVSLTRSEKKIAVASVRLVNKRISTM